MLITLLMGFTSGIPLLLTLSTLKAWMTEVGVDLKTIGIFSLAGLPYTLKFLWAPVFDKYAPLGFGRRRGWLLIAQIGLILTLCATAMVDPKEQTWTLALMTILVSFFSASQDVVVDAYRRESLPDSDLAIGSTLYIYGYRTAMWVSGGFALGLATYVSWSNVYFIMAGTILVGLVTTIWAPEPEISSSTPRTIFEAVIDPLLEFLKRHGAWSMILFILLYKLGDTMAGSLLTPFYLKMGYSKLEIAAIAKTFSLPVSLFGGFIGGVLTYKWGIIRSLWIFGFLQLASTFGFSLLLSFEHDLTALAAVILFEDLTGSMGTAAFVAYMMSLTNKRFTATQYALLTSLMGIPRTVLSAPTGILAEQMGWFWFFTFCAVIAIPGLFLIKVIQKQNEA